MMPLVTMFILSITENVLSPSAPEYDDWLKEQDAMELFEYEQIEQSNNEENEKWLKAESKSLAKWKALQDRMKRAHQQRLEKEARIKLVTFNTFKTQI